MENEHKFNIQQLTDCLGKFKDNITLLEDHVLEVIREIIDLTWIWCTISRKGDIGNNRKKIAGSQRGFDCPSIEIWSWERDYNSPTGNIIEWERRVIRRSRKI